MALVSRVRYVYETFFEDKTRPWIPPTDQLDTVVNHPTVRKMMMSQEAQSRAVLDPQVIGVESPSTNQKRPSSVSGSLHTICSLADEAEDEQDMSEDDDSNGRMGLLLLNRSRSLQQTHLLHPDGAGSGVGGSGRRGFSLYLSPKQRNHRSGGEVILSPISDKSESNENSCCNTSITVEANLTVTPVATGSSQQQRARRPLSLFGKPSGFNSSDSGISISANSLVTSHEALPLQPPSRKSLILSLNNSHGEFSYGFQTNSLFFLSPFCELLIDVLSECLQYLNRLFAKL